MIKHKRLGMLTALFMAAAVLFMGLACLKPGVLASVAGAAEPQYASAMNKNGVLRIQILAEEAQWADMLQNATREEYIPATVIIDGVKLEQVGIRPKGNSSLSTVAQSSTTDRYSFKLEFDHYIKGQTWLGLDKLAVNNMHGDASYMKEYLSYDIMDYAGVDAPLYAFSDISVNGESWGFYLAVEVLEESYAQRVYGGDHGKLYKPESMGMRGAGRMNEFIEEMNDAAPQGEMPQRGGGEPPAEMPQRGGGELPAETPQGEMPQRGGGEPQGEMPQGGGAARGGMGGMGGGMSQGGVSLQYAGDDSADYSAIFQNAVFDATEGDYKRVIAALKKLADGGDLENAVDVEACLRYFAAHTVVVNLDSYISSMGHNYYLYEEDGRLTILPWDYNLAFGGFQSGGASSVVNFPIDTPVSGVTLESRPLLGKLLEVPEYMELYHGYLREIVDGYFGGGLFERTIDALDALIAPYVEADPSAFYDYAAYRAAVPVLRQLGLLRAESIAGQLDGTIPSTSAGQSAEPDKLIDASALDLSALGRQGGGAAFGGGAQGGVQGGGVRADMSGGAPGGDAGARQNIGRRDNPAQGREAQATAARGQAGAGTGTGPGTGLGAWLLPGVGALLFAGGAAFVFSYKRRNPRA